jgi:peptidoglycan/xylan/chitin deacetylase (PgdA/CDA1 family)
MATLLPLAVLMYHDIADSLGGVLPSHRPYVVPTASFEAHLRAMADAGVRGTRLDAHLFPSTGGEVDADRCCIITFDDGHHSNYSKAMPYLLARGFRATFFVTTGWIGKQPYMTWPEIRALASAGMEIGSHSISHRPPSTLARAELERELRDSKRALEDRLGTAVLTFSSPTGFFSSTMIPLARAVGYRALCFGRIGFWTDRSQPFGIPRIPIKLTIPTDNVLRIALGDAGLVRRLRHRQVLLDGLKRVLGVERYIAFRDWLLRLRWPTTR